MNRPNAFQGEIDRWLESGKPATVDTPFLHLHLIEQTDLALIGHRPNGEIVFVNQAAARVLNASRRDLMSTSLWPYLDEEWGQEHRRLMKAATPHDANFEGELRIDNGLVKHYSVQSTTVFHSNGSVGIVWITLHDKTALWDAQHELLVANKHLNEANRDNEDFAYIVSHDLQEPLRKITTFGDRLQRRASDDLDERSAEYLNRMVDASGRMRSLILDLLEFSRVATRGNTFEDTDLRDVIQSILDHGEIAEQTEHATIHLGDLPTVSVDAVQFSQLFRHLIENSIKFASAERPLEIWIDAAIFGGQWLFSVRDNGVGFDQKYAEDIFTVFQRLNKDVAGTGTGLAVCRRIAERHDGSIRALSEIDGGTTILLSIPRTRAELPVPLAA